MQCADWSSSQALGFGHVPAPKPAKKAKTNTVVVEKTEKPKKVPFHDCVMLCVTGEVLRAGKETGSGNSGACASCALHCLSCF